MTNTTKSSETYCLPAPPQLITAQRLADLLGLTLAAVYHRVRLGQIPADCIVRHGRLLRFRVDAVAAWIDAMTAGRTAA